MPWVYGMESWSTADITATSPARNVSAAEVARRRARNKAARKARRR